MTYDDVVLRPDVVSAVGVQKDSETGEWVIRQKGQYTPDRKNGGKPRNVEFRSRLRISGDDDIRSILALAIKAMSTSPRKIQAFSASDVWELDLLEAGQTALEDGLSEEERAKRKEARDRKKAVQGRLDALVTAYPQLKQDNVLLKQVNDLLQSDKTSEAFALVFRTYEMPQTEAATSKKK